VPVLARIIEEAGIPTVVVTMMPDLAEKFRPARIVGVEFPFGHAFGMIHDQEMQYSVAQAAVRLLPEATEPGTRVDLEIEWPVDPRTAYKDWQPAEPSPIVADHLRRRQEREYRSDAL
jgi:hypothetical protein